MEQVQRKEIAAGIVACVQMLLTGDASQIALAEDRLMSLQSGPTWKENLSVYIELASSEEAQLSMVAFIQIKYILKQNAKHLAADDLKAMVRHLVLLKAKIAVPVIHTYSDLIGLALCQLFANSEESFVLEAAREFVQGVTPMLVDAFRQGFTNNDLQIQLQVLLSMTDHLMSEKIYFNDKQKASLTLFYRSLLPNIESTVKAYLDFLKVILAGVDQLTDHNRSKTQDINRLLFMILRVFVKECTDSRDLYASFADFPTIMLESVSRFIDQRPVFDFIVDILADYFTLAISSLDYMKNSFDFLAINLRFALTLFGVSKVVKTVAQSADGRDRLLISSLNFVSRVLSILSLDMEDFLYISLDKDQKDMEMSIAAIVQDNRDNLGNMFLTVAEFGLLYDNEKLREFDNRGLEFIIDEEHVSLETSLREASNHFLRCLVVYLYTTDQTAAADQFMNCMLRMLQKAIDVKTTDMDKSTAIRTAEGCLYFFEKSLSEVKTQFDFTTIVAELNLNENYPEIIAFRILSMFEELVTSVPYISDGVHQAIHAYAGRYLTCHGQPSAKLAAMQATASILAVSKSKMLDSIDMSIFFRQFESMIGMFDIDNESCLLVFGRLMLKLVKSMEGRIAKCVDHLLAAVVFVSDRFCQGKLE